MAVKLTKKKAKAYLLVGVSEGLFGLYLANRSTHVSEKNWTPWMKTILPCVMVLSIVTSAAALVAYKTRKTNLAANLLIPKWML